MHSLIVSSPNPSLIGVFHNNCCNNRRNLARIQIPLLNLVDFKPSASLLAVSCRNYSKNVVSGKRNRFYARNYANQEQEAQISREIEDIGSGSSSSPSTSFLSLLCPLLKLFSKILLARETIYWRYLQTSSLSFYSTNSENACEIFSSLSFFGCYFGVIYILHGSVLFPRNIGGYIIIIYFSKTSMGSRSLSDGLDDQQKELSTEACPFCRRVREAITELDLSVEVFPCPKGSIRHRAMVRRLGGREQFPFLVDPNTGTSMYESSDIAKYLFQQYGGKRNPSFGLLESTLLTGWMPTLLRAGRGMTLWKSSTKEVPPVKLELFSYENNPYARIVREALCELELPYVLQSVGKGSKRAKLLYEMSGSEEVPYLVDRNTGMEIREYKKILCYLFQTYSSATT
ncbi:UNVERIFIED_CONTAM: hypothetical protein Sradi_3683800 [Sesamum radiatum]|uniref:GST N-terminal domain-containing protein n=1 Tax=Sesamum radiatum TaxID=300843 RepID=A0AAW2PX35_SESRA